MQSIADIKNIPFFFIIGRPRSGTTLLRHLFDAHPNVIIPTECSFILTLSSKYKNKKKFDKPTLKSFLAELRQTKFFDKLSIDYDLLEKKIMSASENIKYRDLCKLVHASYISLYKKDEIKLIGDKTPAYSSENFSKIFSLYSESKYIHIVRDYRDQIVSLFAANFKFPSPAFIAIAWKKSIETLERYKRKFPDNFHTIRYEDFVLNPEKHFEEICSFLNIPYNAEVFGFYNKKEDFKKLQPEILYDEFHKSLFKPINRDRVGIWQKQITGNELAVVEKITGKVAEKYAYKKTSDKSNFIIFITIIKWQVLYYFFAVMRSISLTLSIQKRNKIVYKLRKNKVLLSIYNKLIARKLPRSV